MTFLELFENALHAISETATNGDTSDYEERASYILATFCTQCAGLDHRYRSAMGDFSQPKADATYVALSETFPLSEIFAPPAIYYLSAMLTLDENETMSEKFFELYSDALASIQASIPCSCKPIEDRYAMI